MLTVLLCNFACTQDNHVGLLFISNPKDKKIIIFEIFIFQSHLTDSIVLVSGVQIVIRYACTLQCDHPEKSTTHMTGSLIYRDFVKHKHNPNVTNVGHFETFMLEMWSVCFELPFM